MTRSNGLGAPAYTAIAVFSPTLDDASAQSLLNQLESAGIAAYLQSGDGGDELYVDVRQLDRAHGMLPQTAPTGPDSALHGAGEPTDEHAGPGVDEQAWLELVESFNAADASTGGGWSPLEDVGPEIDHGDSDSDSGDAAAGRGSGQVSRRLTGWEPYVRRAQENAPPERPEPEEHFEPPPPPPLPRVSPYVASGWICSIGIPVVLVVLGFAGVIVPSWGLLLAGGGFVYGLSVLFAQLRQTPLDDDGEPFDGDNGAEV